MSNLKLFDVHTHTQFAAFQDDADLVIKRARDAGIWMVNVGTQKDTSAKAVEFANKFSEGVCPAPFVANEDIAQSAADKRCGVYATVGLHPIHTEKSYHDKQELGASSLFSNSRELENSGGTEFTSREEEFDYDYYKSLAKDKGVVAIGECGLDYYRFQPRTDADSPAKISKGNLGGQAQTDADRIKDKQKKAFEAQIALAGEVKKPLMIHCRQAFDDLIDILVSCRLSLFSNPGIIHFFSGTKDDAKKLLDLDFSFSFGGVITFARDYDEVIKYIPMDRITLETDAPYVAPIPYRGKRNEPAYIVEVAKKIAEIKGLEFEEVSSITTANAIKIFRLQN